MPWGAHLLHHPGRRHHRVPGIRGRAEWDEFYKDERLFIADYRISILTLDFASKRLEPNCERVGNERLRGPNDLVFARNGDRLRFSFQPSLDRNRTMALASLDSVDKHEVVHFIGQSCTGKSHFGVAKTSYLNALNVREGR